MTLNYLIVLDQDHFWIIVVAGCSIGPKPHPLYANKWESHQTKKSNCMSNIFLPKMISVILVSSYNVDVCSNVRLVLVSYTIIFFFYDSVIWECVWDHDTMASPRARYCADSGSK